MVLNINETFKTQNTNIKSLFTLIYIKKGGLKLNENRVVIQDKEVTRNVLERINNNPNSIFLFDATDNSYITLDKFMLERIKNYLELL